MREITKEEIMLIMQSAVAAFPHASAWEQCFAPFFDISKYSTNQEVKDALEHLATVHAEVNKQIKLLNAKGWAPCMEEVNARLVNYNDPK